jgi:hypothetical protein
LRGRSPSPHANAVSPHAAEGRPPARRSRARLRRFAAPRTRVRRFERRAKETARRLIREAGGRVEPAGVEPASARRAGPDLSHSRETAYSPWVGGCVTLTVTPHSRFRWSAGWVPGHPAIAGPQNELISSTLIPALSLSVGFGPTWIRTSMSRALRSRSRRPMLNRASLPRTRSDTSG